MKTWIFVAIVLLNSIQFADAEELGRFQNNSGGAIVIDDRPCGNGGKYAFAFSQSGLVEYGCWFYESKMFHIFWNGGEKRVYDLSGFNPSQKLMDEIKKNKKVM